MGTSKQFLLFLLLVQTFTGFSQITYSTVTDGDWDDPSVWNPAVPPGILPVSDSIIVRHNLNFNAGQDVLGTMIVQANASIFTSNKNNLRIGRGGIEEGILYVYGSITVNDLEVKPANGCTATFGLPQIQNFGIITCNDDFQIGNNCAAGLLINHPGGKVYVNDQIHLDHYICNNDSIFIGNTLKVHGGTLDCCGFYEAPLIDIDANPTGRSASFECTNICDQSGASPVINIGGSDFIDLNDAYNNAPASETTIDDDSTFICDFNQLGTFNALPVELVNFKASILNNSEVGLTWQTLSETNNAYFDVQRSSNALDWQSITQIEGNNNSTVQQFYGTVDINPLLGRSYYRLKQVDNDELNYSYSPTVSVQLSGHQKLDVFPNPFKEKLKLMATLDELKNMELFNIHGQQIYLGQFPTHQYQFSTEIDLSGLEDGVYFIKSKNNVQKIVKH